ncbi:MAG TPA: hypothetical protein VMD99_16290 [Terriglobales bacterium]|nr:hypothetical protein [Terriglobales bacterium]
MKARKIRVERRRTPGNRQVRREIQNFLRALNSYPDRFSKNPGISFEQHYDGVIEAAKIEAVKIEAAKIETVKVETVKIRVVKSGATPRTAHPTDAD